MLTNHDKARAFAFLILTLLATLAVPPSSPAGPISDMLARHRQSKQMKLPPMDKPFSNKPVRDLNAKTASLTDRFKKRFSFKRGATEGVIPLNPDLGVMRTSR